MVAVWCKSCLPGTLYSAGLVRPRAEAARSERRASVGIQIVNVICGELWGKRSRVPRRPFSICSLLQLDLSGLLSEPTMRPLLPLILFFTYYAAADQIDWIDVNYAISQGQRSDVSTSASRQAIITGATSSARGSPWCKTFL